MSAFLILFVTLLHKEFTKNTFTLVIIDFLKKIFFYEIFLLFILYSSKFSTNIAKNNINNIYYPTIIKVKKKKEDNIGLTLL